MPVLIKLRQQAQLALSLKSTLASLINLKLRIVWKINFHIRNFVPYNDTTDISF
jgi:hypothetical protein